MWSHGAPPLRRTGCRVLLFLPLFGHAVVIFGHPHSITPALGITFSYIALPINARTTWRRHAGGNLDTKRCLWWRPSQLVCFGEGGVGRPKSQAYQTRRVKQHSGGTALRLLPWLPFRLRDCAARIAHVRSAHDKRRPRGSLCCPAHDVGEHHASPSIRPCRLRASILYALRSSASCRSYWARAISASS